MPDRGLEAGPGAPLGGVKGSEVSREEAQDRHTAPGQAAGLQAATAAQSPGWGRDGSVRQGGDVSVPFLALQGCTGGWGEGRRPPQQGAAEVSESVPVIVQMPAGSAQPACLMGETQPRLPPEPGAWRSEEPWEGRGPSGQCDPVRTVPCTSRRALLTCALAASGVALLSSC